MSHIHLPDGILPVWLWGAGWLIVIIFFILSGGYLKKDLNRKMTMAAMFSAVMIIAQSFEIVPIAYHFNLAAISGIFIGPVWMIAASFVVNLALAMFGHGGITVVGLNTLILATEGIIGFYLFRFSAAIFKNLSLRGFLATFVSLLASSALAVTIIAAGTAGSKFDLGKFISLVFVFGFAGWFFESFLSSAVISYLNKVRPDPPLAD